MNSKGQISAAQPLVSIVIPCWNSEAYIGDAIDSALAQTYSNIEVIVIDDGSTDGSLEVIRSFGDRIRWLTGPNRGGCAARNRGIKLAGGEFIQFLDADDVLLPWKLATQVVVAQKHSNNITYTDHECRMEGESRLVVRSRTVTDADPFVFVLQHRTLGVSGPLYRRTWLREIGGFRDKLRCSQEFEMNLRLAMYLSRSAGHFVHIPEAHFEVRRRRGSISSNTAQTFAVKAEYLPIIVSELRRNNELTVHRRAELAAYSAAIGRQCIRGGEVTPGLNLIRIAESLDRKSAESRAWGRMSRFVKCFIGPVATERLALITRCWAVRVRN